MKHIIWLLILVLMSFNNDSKDYVTLIGKVEGVKNDSLKKLSDFKGKIFLLEFWASWCGPCRKENPNLNKIYKIFKSNGFEIVSVSLDNNKKSWIKAIKEDNLSWEQLSDLNGDYNKAAIIYGVSTIPDNFLIDKDGKIIGRKLKGEELIKKLNEVLE